jgi:hypothetical protein
MVHHACMALSILPNTSRSACTDGVTVSSTNMISIIRMTFSINLLSSSFYLLGNKKIEKKSFVCYKILLSCF